MYEEHVNVLCSFIYFSMQYTFLKEWFSQRVGDWKKTLETHLESIQNII